MFTLKTFNQFFKSSQSSTKQNPSYYSSFCLVPLSLSLNIDFILLLDTKKYSNRCTQIKMYSWDNAQVVLVGNKMDLEDERVIVTDRGKRLAEELGTP